MLRKTPAETPSVTPCCSTRTSLGLPASRRARKFDRSGRAGTGDLGLYDEWEDEAESAELADDSGLEGAEGEHIGRHRRSDQTPADQEQQ